MYDVLYMSAVELEDKPAIDEAGKSSTGIYEDLVFIERVLEVTRCRDRKLVSELCAEAGYFDLDTVCSHVLAFMHDGVAHSSSGSSSTTSSEDAELTPSSTATSSTVTSSSVAGAKPKKTTRRQRKQEKKCRAAERHRMANAAGVAKEASGVARDAPAGCHGSSDDDDAPFVISQQLKVLQI